MLTESQVVRDLTGCRVHLVHRDRLLLLREVVMGDRDEALLGVILLNDVQDVPCEDVVGTFQVIQHLRHVDAAALLLVSDGLRRHVLTVKALHRVAHVRDRLDVLLSLVGNPIQPGRRLVRLDLRRRRSAFLELQHQTGLGTTGFEFRHRNVDKAVLLNHPTAVRRGVHHVQLLRRGLVQDLLRPQQVLDDPDGAPVTEVREVRYNGEVLVRRPVIVQHEVVCRHRPPNPLHQLLQRADPPTGFFQQESDPVTIPARRHRAHIPSGHIHEMKLLVQFTVLTIDHADIPPHTFQILDPVVTQPREHGASEPVTYPLDAVVTVGITRRLAVFQSFSIILVVQDRNILVRHPLRREHVGPTVRVVLLGIRVDTHVLTIQEVYLHLALHRVREIKPHVVEPTGADNPITEHVGTKPRELVLLADLHPHLAQRFSGLCRRPSFRAKEHFRPVVDLFTKDRPDGGQNFVDRQRRSALLAQDHQVLF